MKDELASLISSLTEDNFKKLVQSFLKEKYNTPHVRIVDGPYDGGNDLEVFIGEKEIKRNIQVTVQKLGFEKKLESDLQKAKDNFTKYAYMANLDFYVNQNISKETINKLKLKAEIYFGINLEIFDANTISQLASLYPSIKEFAYGAHNINVEKKLNITDKQTKILFDVLTLDQNSIEIKRNFINSYIFSFLYANPESTLEEIFDYINPHINYCLSKEYIEKELNFLKSKKHLVTPTDKRHFRLSDEKTAEINDIFNNVAVQENELTVKLEDFISRYGIASDGSELISMLYKLYQANYTIDIEEIKNTNDSFSASIRKNFNDLIVFFIKKGFEEESAKKASKELLRMCQENDYLNKLSSTHLFNNLYSSNKLEKYINTKSQKVFVDTQILIRLVSVIYDDEIEYQDIAMQSVKLLYKTFSKFKERIILISSYDYVDEVAGHLYEAFKLQRFLRLPFVAKLGKSKNVFYNTFIELKEKELLDESEDFADFIEELLDEDISGLSEEDFLDIAKERISEILEQLNFELIYHQSYQNYLQIKKEYEMSLAYQAKYRSYKARENDLRTILHLSTKENHSTDESGNINEPFLITWDSAFYTFRKELLKAHKELSYWYIYSPLKFVDRLAVMNFQLNPESISLNIVALTETNFNYSTKTTSFLDVISSFFNTQDVSKLTIIHKLAKLKETTRSIDEVPMNSEMGNAEDDRLTNVLIDIRNHYSSYESKFKFNDIVHLFELPKFEDQIVGILSTTLEKYQQKETISSMVASFDKLIFELKK